MAGSRYSQIVDLENCNSSHSLAVLSVPPRSRVLDLGTADGSVARALKERGCTVWGIELDEHAAEAALQVCDRVIVADLEARDAFDVLGDETFDVVLALDVLEHLREPAPVLKRAARQLTPQGIVIVSLPNVTHGALRLSLLEGRFNYTEQGLLDRTHLRFFDRHAAERLMSDAGLTISQHLRVRRELDETEIAIDKNVVSAELLKSLAGDPDATTYQFVFVAGRENGLPESTSGGMLSERLLAENEALAAQFRELETYAKHLEADREARIAGSTAELKQCQDELARTQSMQSHATAAHEALRAQFTDLETYAKSLESDRAARVEAGARELKQCQDELARAQSMQARATAECLQVQRERDEVRQELVRRTEEAHQTHRDLRQRSADVAVKEAFISDLRQQLLAINPLMLERDQLRAERDQLVVRQKRLLAKHEQLSARRDQLVEERRRLLARQQSLEKTLRALQAFTNSTRFRIVEGAIARLRSFPLGYKAARAIARKIAGRRDETRS